jgi:hypothetical protein
MVTANKETTQSRIPNGEIQGITWKVFLMPPRLVYPFLIHDLTVGNKTDVASGAAIAYPSRAPEFLLAKV